MTVTTRSDPTKINSSLKEAVVDALLNVTHARISGTGEFGEVLYGARPRSLLNSGFLLPARTDVEGDEVTSPIWVSAHGCDLQIARGVSESITLQPLFAFYVRVLPTEDEVKHRADCRPSFRLRRDVQLRIRQRRRTLEVERWEQVKGTYSSRAHPEWKKLCEEIREQVHREEGVPPNLAEVGVPEDHDTDAAEIPEGAENLAIVAGIAAIKDEHFEPLSIPAKWIRLDVAVPALVYPVNADDFIRQAAVEAHEAGMRDAIEKRITEWLTTTAPDNGGQLWAFRHDVEVRPSQYRDWSRFLTELRKLPFKIPRPELKPKWDIRVAPDWLDSTRLNVHVALENRSEEKKQHVDETDPTLFQVAIEVVLPSALHKPLHLERVEPSYRYNRYLAYPAMGFNGGVMQIEAPPDKIRLMTTWAPRYNQPRMVAIGHVGIERNVRRLSQPDSLEGIEALPARMREWLEGLPTSVDCAAGLAATDVDAIEREKAKFADDLNKWRAEIEAIEAGVAILKESRAEWDKRGLQSSSKAKPYEAWLATNEAMADLMRERFGNDDGEWRLFQLAFILASIPAMASRLPDFRSTYKDERDDAVTLLYFPTGGGKSEAFFGLLLFTLFLDRLRGKEIGVTAMIRYPLRLLTIQQAQRASRVLAKAELVRRRHKYGGSAFSIGFWVGSGGSPNRLNAQGVSDIPSIETISASIQAEEKLADNNETYNTLRTAWRKLPKCPFCASANALRRFPAHGGTLAHVCTNEKCEANVGGFRPLPFYICDEDIYDFAPSVVLGTVDKLALIGHSAATIRRVLGMFGSAPWRSTITGRLRVPSSEDLRAGPGNKHCEGLAPAYPEGIGVWVDPFPALLIQDEAHLLDESLGTFAGLFESTLDAIFAYLFPSLNSITAVTAEGKRRRAKVVAASATVADPERQLEHLYQRHAPAIQFPHPGPDLYHSFYAVPAPAEEAGRRDAEDVEVASKLGRVYAGFMTNGRPHTATSVAVLSNFHVTISSLFDALVNGGPAGLQRVRSLLGRYLSQSVLKPIHQASLQTASAEDLVTLIDLHRIALTYVTNKKGGDQIMAAEAEETRKRHAAEDIAFTYLGSRLITGSVDQGEIQDVVDTAQRRPKPGETFPPLDETLRSVIATSAVSHGVDVEELNSMFFAGLPSDVAEYIQASSRVGRTHVGICVLIPTPQRRRDRYVIEVFDQFHRFLERMVQPAAVDRWAEHAVERVMPSLFQAYVCGVTPSTELIARPAADKSNVRSNEAIADISSAYNTNQTQFLACILAFIETAIGLDSNFAPEEHAADYYRNIIERRIRHLLLLLNEPNYRSGHLSGFFQNQRDIMFKPMTSLRDVDEPGLIHMARRDYNNKKQDPAQVKKVLGFVCNGVAEMGDEGEGA